MPDPTKVLAIIKDPKKRQAIPPALLEVIEKSLAPADATNTEGVDPIVAQRSGGTIASEALRNNIDPVGYKGHGSQIKDAITAMLTGRSGEKGPSRGQTSFGPKREDAWNLFLGLPQVANTFVPSTFKPAKSEENKRYLSLRESPIPVDKLKEYVEATKVYKSQGRQVPAGDPFVMANYKLDLGQDEKGHYISYYDVWDLKPEVVNLLGKPFEIYGRQYYDPETYKPVSPKLTDLDLKEIQDWAGKNLTTVKPDAKRR